MFGALNDPYLVLLVLFCAAAIIIGAVVTALHRVPRTQFTQLQTELKELSERVSLLETAEQRRFVRELNSRSKGEANQTTNGSGRLEAESPVHQPRP
jgi:uncharacterized protein HemX